MNHTWKLNLKYHDCPSCGKVVESRQDYTLEKDQALKKLICPRCGHHWEERKKVEKSIFPLFGAPPKPEFNWE